MAVLTPACVYLHAGPCAGATMREQSEMLVYQLMANLGITFDDEGGVTFINGQIPTKNEFKRNIIYALRACKFRAPAPARPS